MEYLLQNFCSKQCNKFEEVRKSYCNILKIEPEKWLVQDTWSGTFGENADD